MNFINYDRFKDLLDAKIVAMLFPEYGETDWQYRRQAVHIYTFPQTWGSTTCGARGIGGASCTKTLTTVFLSNNHDKAVVFINDEFRYLVEKCSPVFFEDLKKMQMAGTKFAKYEDVK